MKFEVIQGGRQKNSEDARLFREARAAISRALEAIAEYNRIREKIESCGYGIDASEGRRFDVIPVPHLSLDGGCITVDGPEFLDEWESAGPLPAKVAARYRRELDRLMESTQRASAGRQVAL